MNSAQANTALSKIDGVAQNASVALQPLSLMTAVRLASFGIDVDHQLYFDAGLSLAANSAVVIAGATFRVVRCQLPVLPGDIGEALLKQTAAAPVPAPGTGP